MPRYQSYSTHNYEKRKLEHLELYDHNLSELPPEIGELKELRDIAIRKCNTPS